MGAASVSEYVASLNEEQRRHISAFIDFMSAKYPQLTSKISFSMPMWLLGKKMYEGYVAISAAKAHFSIHFPTRSFLTACLIVCPPARRGSGASTLNTAMKCPFMRWKKASAIS